MCSPAVIGAVNRIFQGLRVTQVAAYGLAIPVWDETAEFLPNPRYRGGRSPGAASKWVSDELGDTSISATSYFTGRDRALEELVTWLGCPQNDGRARVVTGSPGTGKSALLAHLVALADMDAPQSTDAHEGVKAFLPPVIPPAGCIDLAIYARGRSVDDIAAMLGAKLQCGARAADVVETLQGRKEPFGLVVDALDEAVDPFKISRELLRPIAAIPAVKLLVGRRPDNDSPVAVRRVTGLGTSTVEINLDQAAYFKAEDVQTYVARRLLAEDEPNRSTLYRARPQLVENIARSVAAQSGSVFLIARSFAIPC